LFTKKDYKHPNVSLLFYIFVYILEIKFSQK